MKFVSLFSGIGGFDLGFERAGMQCVAHAEINEPASGVLARHWPSLPNLGDVKEIHGTEKPFNAAQLVCGGFPCQDLSVAGRRAGLAGQRSSLWFEFRRLLERARPKWVVVENVPGLLSSHRGRDFAVLLQGLAELGYGVAWRVFDTQYFGCAQRRERVFIVGHLGDGRAAQVLFEPEGVRWNPPSRGEARQDIAPTLKSGPDSPRSHGKPSGNDDAIVVQAFAQNTRDEVRLVAGDGGITGALASDNGVKQQTYVVGFDRTNSASAGEIVPALRSMSAATGGVNDGQADAACVFVAPTLQGQHRRDDADSVDSIVLAGPVQASDSKGNHLQSNFVVGALSARDHKSPREDIAQPNIIIEAFAPRRLMPIEHERLQGFPDGWTAGQSDSQRYKQLGNAVSVPVVEWIGRRIVEVEKNVQSSSRRRGKRS